VSFSEDGDTAHFKNEGDSSFSVFWTDGEVWTKNPDDSVISALFELAQILGGRLRGDEFETYREDGSTYIHPDDSDEESDQSEAGEIVQRKSGAWKLIRMIGIFVVIGIVILKKCGEL
jgi:hypothetical protein